MAPSSAALAREPGKGTTFSIYFPRTTEIEVVEETAVANSTDFAGRETILLVEDEEVLRMLAARMLGELGYTVLEAANGFDALKILSECKTPVDLILTDLVMPEMSGRELIERVRSKGTAPKVLYMSGYTDDDVIREGINGAEIAFLQKPFTSGILLRKVRETIDEN